MPKVTNTFIKSKLNKDLDARLIPNGEYRDAVNVQVSRSESDSVGSLENVLGNKLIKDFGNTNLTCIGYFANDTTGMIYLFLTSHTDQSPETQRTYNPSAQNFIYSYNVVDDTSVLLVQGSFLNFSKTNPIFGVNQLEEFLFWTDNRNQPRKINVIDGATLGYYTTEDQISVAKYNPYQVIELFEESDLSPGDYETTMKDVVSKFLPNGGSCVTTAAASGGTVVIPIGQIQIQFYPSVPTLGMAVKRVDSSGNIVPVQYQGVDIFPTVVSYNEAAGTMDLSQVADIPQDTELIFNENPYYINGYNGDPRFLEDKFVRFSYRFKFDDGEYSLIAPFTQPCFIPKQDGYFLNETEKLGDMQQAYSSTILDFMENKVNKIDLRIPLPSNASDLRNDFHITDIDILYKESDGLAIQVVETIQTETPIFSSITGDVYEYSYQSQKPYKTLPSKETTRVYDKVPVKAFGQEVISNRIVYANYQDKHTPPAFLNYNVTATQKSDFSVAAEGAVGGSVSDTTSKIEYPNSTLKTNRTYQASIVLSDRFGRSSTAILSNATGSISIGIPGSQTTFYGSSLYSPYNDESIDPIDWVGNSLKIIFNSTVGGNKNPATNAPGIYNGDIASEDYNPLGWYSYKVVIKQTEQEYYNVFSAGSIKGLPYDNISDDGVTIIDKNTSFISLLNDNINKIPRDLSEVGPQDKSFRSSVELYGRVQNTLPSTDVNTNLSSDQFYPGRKSFTVSSIETLYDMFDVDSFEGTGTTPIPITESTNAYSSFYKSDSNPLIARITTTQSTETQFGVENLKLQSDDYTPVSSLVVFETKPVESRLDIFWETSTTGLVSELNEAILNADNGAAFLSNFNTTPFDEGIEPAGSYILSSAFTISDSLGTPIPPAEFDTDITMTVTDTQSTPQLVPNYFTLVKIDPLLQNYNIAVTQAFIEDVYYGSNQGLRNFVFTFYVNVRGNATEEFIKEANLRNLSPTITTNGGIAIDIDRGNNIDNIYDFSAINGAFAVNNKELNDLNWDILSGNDDGYFSLANSNTSTCTLYNDFPSTIPAASYPLVIRVSDGGGLSDTIDFNINFSANVTSVIEYIATITVDASDRVEYYFTIIEVTDWEDTSKNGWYVYNNAWSSLAGTTKQINWTDSNKNSVGCVGDWYFNSSSTSVIDHWKDCVIGPSDPPLYEGTTIDTTGVNFTII